MYIKPILIEISTEELSKYIKAYANSDTTLPCSGLTANYVSGGGCGHIYSIGRCELSHNCDGGHY